MLISSKPTHNIWLILGLLLILEGCASGPQWRSLPDRSLPFDQAWKMIEEGVEARYPQVLINEPEKGYLETDWRLEKIGLVIGAPVTRTRVSLWVVNRSPVRIRLKVERQEYSLPLGRWLDKPDEEDPVLVDLAEDLNGRFQRF